MRKYTLVTGASKGIGLEMSRRCAALGRNVIMVSLPGEGVGTSSSELAKKANVECDFFECDLSQFKSIDELYSWVEEKGYLIDFLINNAGFGGTSAFELHSSEYIKSMLNLNVIASTLLMNKFVPMLQKNKSSNILNVASMLAGVPTPYKALYAASKTYIRNISIALSYELEASGVGVSVLITGASPTNEIVKDQIENGALAARITAMAPADIAKISIDKALSGKRIITTSFKNKLIMNFIASLPYSVLSKVSINQYLKLNK